MATDANQHELAYKRMSGFFQRVELSMDREREHCAKLEQGGREPGELQNAYAMLYTVSAVCAGALDRIAGATDYVNAYAGTYLHAFSAKTARWSAAIDSERERRARDVRQSSEYLDELQRSLDQICQLAALVDEHDFP